MIGSDQFWASALAKNIELTIDGVLEKALELLKNGFEF
jgi:hypothetical protein